MKRSLYHIIRLALVIIPVLLTMANAMAQVPVWLGPEPVYKGQTTQFGIEEIPGDTYTWEVYNDSTINFATVAGTAVADGQAEFVDGLDTGPQVAITWLEAGVYFYKVTAVNSAGCTDNLRVGRIRILESFPTAKLALNPDEICITEPSVISVTFTGIPLWSITLEATDVDGIVETYTYDNIDADSNPYEITVSPDKTTTYKVTRVTDKYGENLEPSNAVTLTVHPLPVTSPIYVKP